VGKSLAGKFIVDESGQKIQRMHNKLSTRGIQTRNLFSSLENLDEEMDKDDERRRKNELGGSLQNSTKDKNKRSSKSPKILLSKASRGSRDSIFLRTADEAYEFVEEASQFRRLSFCALVATQLQPERKRKRDIAWPYFVRGVVSGGIYMLGEAISCGLFSREGRIGLFPDAFLHSSVLHSTLIGALANGPMLHFFFEMVDRYVKHSSVAMTVILKVLVDQVIWGILWNFSYILLMNVATDSPGFGYVGEGLGMDFVFDLYKGLLSAFWKASDWKLHSKLLVEGLKMLPMDIICYWLVPLQLRALWVVSVDVFWVTILSRHD
jgi:hypothetical protein